MLGRRAVALFAGCAGLLAACGGDPAAKATKVNVTVKPSAQCNAVAARRRLGADPPALGPLIQNIDIDNFSGSTSANCNARQIVYLEPGLGVRAHDRRGVFVRLIFPENVDGARRLLFAGRRPTRVSGRSVVFYEDEGSRSASLRIGPAIVTITVACSKEPDRLVPRPCGPQSALPALLAVSLRDLVPALQGRLE